MLKFDRLTYPNDNDRDIIMLFKKFAIVATVATTLSFVACTQQQEATKTEQKPAATETATQSSAIDTNKIDAAPVEGPVAPNPNAPEQSTTPTEIAQAPTTAENTDATKVDTEANKEAEKK